MKTNKFIIPAVLFFGLAFLASCDKDSGPLKGEGPVIEQVFVLPTVTSVGLNIDANVVLTHGETEEVIIKGQENIIDNIEKYVNADGYWNINYDRNVRSHAGVTIYITSPYLDYISVSGSGSVNSVNIFPDSTNVILKISGSGNISFSTLALLAESDISGSGEIYLSGNSDEHRINISGSGNVRAFDFLTKTTKVKISGSGYSEVFVEELLDVDISGSGDVYYKGYPQILSDISGSGGIHNSNK